MLPSPAGKPFNVDALAMDVIVPITTKAGIPWYGWHTFHPGLATNLHQLEIADKTIQNILRQVGEGVTKKCYIKTTDSDAEEAMQKLERSLEYQPSMHLSGRERPQVM